MCLAGGAHAGIGIELGSAWLHVHSGVAPSAEGEGLPGRKKKNIYFILICKAHWFKKTTADQRDAVQTCLTRKKRVLKETLDSLRSVFKIGSVCFAIAASMVPVAFLIQLKMAALPLMLVF